MLRGVLLFVTCDLVFATGEFCGVCEILGTCMEGI